MFKNTNSKRMTGILLALVLVTSVFIGGSIARYVTSTSSEDDARVAKWGFSETAEPVTMDLFKNEYKLEDGTVVAKSANESEDIIAPGLNGVSKFKFITSSVEPEVMYEVKISVDDSEIADEIKNHPGIQWKVDNGNWVSWDEMVASLVSLSGDPSGMKVYAPGELHNNFKSNAEHTIAWQWVMDSGYDVEDTRLGNLAASGIPITAEIVVTVLAQQTDIDSTGMLEGNGSVVNSLDPQPLTFRADDNYEDFTSVKINGDTINKGTDYTVEPGSIKIKLLKSYLKTLGNGKYTITIVSKNKETDASFTIKENTNIIHNAIIPEGGTYYVNVKNTTLGEFTNYDAKLTAGNTFPEPKKGDMYVYEDYIYAFGLSLDYIGNTWENNNASSNGWGVGVLDKAKTEYSAMLSTISNKPVNNMSSAFWGNTSITKGPILSENLTEMAYAFEGCTNLITAPIIPNSVISMFTTFSGCTKLEQPPILSSNLQTFAQTFYNCTALKNAPVIPNTVTYMGDTFAGCTSLTTAPVIPNSVDYIGGAFKGCTNLTGTIEINANITYPPEEGMSFLYDDCIKGTQITEITGSLSNEIKEILLSQK